MNTHRFCDISVAVFVHQAKESLSPTLLPHELFKREPPVLIILFLIIEINLICLSHYESFFSSRFLPHPSQCLKRFGQLHPWNNQNRKQGMYFFGFLYFFDQFHQVLLYFLKRVPIVWNLVLSRGGLQQSVSVKSCPGGRGRWRGDTQSKENMWHVILHVHSQIHLW